MRRIVLSSALFLTLALAGCGGDHRAEGPVEVRATGERLVLRESVVADLKPVAATVTTRDLGEARARIGGTLVRLSVKEGDKVRKGQVIAMVADRRLGFETGAYEAQVAAASAEAVRAEADLKRIQTLYDQGVYAKARLEQAEAAARAARGGLDAARAQRAASAELMDQGAILAPTDGRVLRADTPAGSVVAPGQSVATITAGDPLLRIEIPEAQARALRMGDTVSIATEDLPGVAPTGRIVQVYPAVTAGRVVADVTAEGLDARLVGQRVRVRVKVGERRALVVPRAFVSTRHGLDFVRVQTRTGAAGETPVQIAPGPKPGEVEVLSGLEPGDTLVARKAAS